jgi:hypothetical protein
MTFFATVSRPDGELAVWSDTSMLAELIALFWLNMKENSMTPKTKTRKIGTTRANSTAAAPESPEPAR